MPRGSCVSSLTVQPSVDTQGASVSWLDVTLQWTRVCRRLSQTSHTGLPVFSETRLFPDRHKRSVPCVRPERPNVVGVVPAGAEFPRVFAGRPHRGFLCFRVGGVCMSPPECVPGRGPRCAVSLGRVGRLLCRTSRCRLDCHICLSPAGPWSPASDRGRERGAPTTRDPARSWTVLRQTLRGVPGCREVRN